MGKKTGLPNGQPHVISVAEGRSIKVSNGIRGRLGELSSRENKVVAWFALSLV